MSKPTYKDILKKMDSVPEDRVDLMVEILKNETSHLSNEDKQKLVDEIDVSLLDAMNELPGENEIAAIRAMFGLVEMLGGVDAEMEQEMAELSKEISELFNLASAVTEMKGTKTPELSKNLSERFNAMSADDKKDVLTLLETLTSTSKDVRLNRFKK